MLKNEFHCCASVIDSQNYEGITSGSLVRLSGNDVSSYIPQTASDKTYCRIQSIGCTGIPAAAPWVLHIEALRPAALQL